MRDQSADPFAPQNRKPPVPRLMPAEERALLEIAARGIEQDDDEDGAVADRRHIPLKGKK